MNTPKKLTIIDETAKPQSLEAAVTREAETESEQLDVRLVRTEQLRPSPSNPRRELGDLTELEASIKELGILVPLLARQLDGGALELVYGHRRLEAAKRAGVDVVPVEVRELTDRDVLEMQLVENLQREGLNPLELAAGYARLAEEHGLSVERVATVVGKSRATVYSVMKLNDLVDPEALTAVKDGRLPFSTALLLARIPVAKLQSKAAKQVLHPGWGDGLEIMSYREAADLIQREYMLELKKASFDLADATLVPDCGACNGCPKRTSTQPELFEDAKGADLCTDPGCYRAKEDASWAQKVAASEAGAGPKALPDVEAKHVFAGDYGAVKHDAPYIMADGTCHEDEKYRTYRQLLGRAAKQHVVLARSPRGEVVELVPKAGLKQALDDAAIIQRKARGSSPEERKAREKERAKEELQERARALAMGELVEKVEKAASGPKLWRLLAMAAADFCMGDSLPQRRGLEDGWEKKWLPKLGEEGHRGVLLELLLEDQPTHFDAALELYSVDLKGIEKRLKDEARAAQAEKNVQPKKAKPAKEER